MKEKQQLEKRRKDLREQRKRLAKTFCKQMPLKNANLTKGENKKRRDLALLTEQENELSKE